MPISIIDQMKTANQTTPKLRFPEFSGEWEERKLGEISTIVRGGSPRPIDDFLTMDTNGLNWLKIGDVDKESKYVLNTQERVVFSALGKTREVNPGDLILSNSMSFGRPYILKIKTCIHDGWIAITKISATTGTDYLYYLIATEPSQSYFSDNAAGSGVQNLNADIIKLLPVLIPPIPEQQKIADCLSSLDDLITAENKKLDALKTHKKGLMQQLFPAEGETVPRLRFPEFSGDWEERKLGEVARIQSGGTPDRKNADYWGGNIPWVTTSLIDSNTIHNVDEFITEAGLKNSSAKIFPKETILMAMYGQGKTRGKVAVLGISAATNQACAAIIVNGKIEVEFLLQNLMSRYEEIRKISNSGGQENLSAGLIENINIPLPENKLEQQKIADFLSSVDELISAQIKKIDALKTHKKGLMQQLFPVLSH